MSSYNSIVASAVARHLLNDNAADRVISASIGSDGVVDGTSWGNGPNTNTLSVAGPIFGGLRNNKTAGFGIPCELGDTGSVSFRFRVDATPTAPEYLISHRNGTTNSRVYLRVGTDRRLDSFFGSSSAVTGSIIDLDTWYSATLAWGGGTLQVFINGVLDITVSSTFSGGWLGRFTLLAFAQVSPSINQYINGAASELSTYTTQLTAADASELSAGPEPLNTTIPTLSFGDSTWTGTVGTWDSQNNGTITYVWELRRSSDNVPVQSGTGSSPSGSNPTSENHYLWVRGTNNGGFDSAEDSVSLSASPGIGGVIITPTTNNILITEFAPAVTATANVVVVPNATNLTINTFIPTVNVSSNIVVNTNGTNLSLITYNPNVVTTENISFVPITKNLSTEAFRPTVNISSVIIIELLTAELNINKLVPTVSTTNNVLLTPNTASLVLTKFKPRIDQNILINTINKQLVLTPYSPIIKNQTLPSSYYYFNLMR
jgi:hypothetical protein